MAARETEDVAVGDIWECGYGHLFMSVQTSPGEFWLLCIRGGDSDKVGKLYYHHVEGWKKVGHFDGI